MESIRGGVGTDGKSSCDLGSIVCDQERLHKGDGRWFSSAYKVGV